MFFSKNWLWLKMTQNVKLLCPNLDWCSNHRLILLNFIYNWLIIWFAVIAPHIGGLQNEDKGKNREKLFYWTNNSKRSNGIWLKPSGLYYANCSADPWDPITYFLWMTSAHHPRTVILVISVPHTLTSPILY